MSRTIKSATISSRTIENDDAVIDGRLQHATPAVAPGAAAPALANWGTATVNISGNKVTVVVTNATGATTGDTITVLHTLGVAPRAVAVVPISGPNTLFLVVGPGSITSSQFVISGSTNAPQVGTYVFELVVIL